VATRWCQNVMYSVVFKFLFKCFYRSLINLCYKNLTCTFHVTNKGKILLIQDGILPINYSWKILGGIPPKIINLNQITHDQVSRQLQIHCTQALSKTARNFSKSPNDKKKHSCYLMTMTRKGSQIKFMTANDTASGCLLGIGNRRILGQLCRILWLVWTPCTFFLFTCRAIM